MTMRSPLHISRSATSETEWNKHQEQAPQLWAALLSETQKLDIPEQALSRIHEFIQIRARKKELPKTPKHQNPSAYLPGLGAFPLHDPHYFSWVPKLKKAFPDISSELRNIQNQRFFDEHDAKMEEGNTWDAFYFFDYGKKFEENFKMAPKTSAMVESIVGKSLGGMAYFSSLSPKTHIKAHCGWNNLKLRCHMGLSIPPDCKIRVGNLTRTWKEGECLIFDESFEHEVWNNSNQNRVILILDVWHPGLTPEEVQALEILTHLVRA